MKTNNKLTTLVLLVFCSLTSMAQVGIGTSTPNANSALELSSSSQGILFPRMTSAQRDAIASPAKGLTIFNTDLNCIQTNTGTSSAANWKCLGISPSTNGTAVVSTYSCSTASAGTMTAGVAVSGVTQTITATVGAVGTYSISATANGVTFAASGTFAGTGTQNIVLAATGTPTVVSGCTSFNFTLNTSPNCSFSRIVTTAIVDVTNPATGKIWMDRNLGASVVATASTTVAAYGDLYQWGRLTDGHQCRTLSGTTTTLSSSDVPGNANYITTTSSTSDWRSPSNPNLWQGLNGINNPCPSGYRLPTEAEWTAESTTWSSNNAAGAIGSPLKLPAGGGRRYSDGALFDVATTGYYSSSDVSGGVSSRFLKFNSGSAGMNSNGRSWAYSVRCIKGDVTSGGTAVVSAYSCSTASAGTISAGVAVSGATQTITATVTTVGTYNISAIANGVTFNATGTFAGTGAQTIVLTATGTPTAAGSHTFTLNTTPNCDFSRTTITVPGAPTSPVATAGNAQASIAFVTPVSNGGSAITGYTVTSSPGGFTATGASSPLIVTGLTNGTTYTFTVVATNVAGNSVASAASAAVTPFLCGTSTVTFTYNGSSVTYGTVSSTGGKCWLDRNLGATQVATSSTDAASYGGLFQWGRGADGHQIASSSLTTSLSSTDAPGNANFIKVLSSNPPNDWRSPQNNNLWQDVNGINNPCPSGFRLPTSNELNAERTSWTSNNAAGAFASPLKLPLTIGRNSNDGGLFGGQSYGYYWSSTVSGTNVQKLYINGSAANIDWNFRADGMSVRCIKD